MSDVPQDALRQIKKYNWPVHRVSSIDRAVLSILLKTFPKIIKLDELAELFGVSKTTFISHYRWGIRNKTVSRLDHSTTRLYNLGFLALPDGCSETETRFDEEGNPIYPICDYCKYSPIAGKCNLLLLKSTTLPALDGDSNEQPKDQDQNITSFATTRSVVNIVNSKE